MPSGMTVSLDHNTYSLFVLSILIGLSKLVNTYPIGVNEYHPRDGGNYIRYSRVELLYNDGIKKFFWANANRKLTSREFINSIYRHIRGRNQPPATIKFFRAGHVNYKVFTVRTWSDFNDEEYYTNFLSTLFGNRPPEQLPRGVIEHNADDIEAHSRLPRMDVKYSDDETGHFYSDSEHKLLKTKFFKSILRVVDSRPEMPTRITYHMRGKEEALTHFSDGELHDPKRIHREFSENEERYRQFNPQEYKQDVGNTFGLREKPVRPLPIGVLEYKNSEGEADHMYPYMKAQYRNGDSKHYVFPWDEPALTPEFFRVFRRKGSNGNWEMPEKLTYQKGQLRDHIHPDISNSPVTYTVDDTAVDPWNYHSGYMDVRNSHERVQKNWEDFQERSRHQQNRADN